MSNLPTLYHKGRGGSIYSWRVWTEGDTILTEYGTVSGLKQIASKIAVGKNVGRSNETTAPEQARLEAAAMHKFKLDRKYSLSPDEAQEELFLPMLAHDWAKKPKYVKFPCDVDAKYDGCRAFAVRREGSIQLISRQGKLYNCPQLSQALSFIPNRCMLDGEIFLPGVGFQTITSWLKKNRPESSKLQFVAYDVPIYDDTTDFIWSSRKDQLDEILAKVPARFKETVIRAVSNPASSIDEVKELHGQYREAGYEGAILRMPNGVYEWGYRSPNLLKYKEFDEDEFPIVGADRGVGKFADCVIWTLRTPSGKLFRAVPKGTLEQKQGWLRDATEYVGKMGTVTYQGLTDDGIPRFPVCQGFKEDR